MKKQKETEMHIVVTKFGAGYIATYMHRGTEPFNPAGVGEEVMDAVRDLFYTTNPEEEFEKLL